MADVRRRLAAGGSAIIDNGTSLTAAGIGTVLYDRLELFDLIDAAPRILDDGDVGWGEQGSWLQYGGGYQGDIHARWQAADSNVASWTFDGVTPGDYVVSATWPVLAEAISNATFTVKNVLDGVETVLGTAVVDQSALPTTFREEGVLWQDFLDGSSLVERFHITGHTLKVELPASPNGTVVADAVRIERITDNANPPPNVAPEIRVQQLLSDGTWLNLVDGTSAVSFGATEIGTPVVKTLRVQNVGSAALTLGAMTLPAGFSVSPYLGSLSVGGSLILTVTLDGTAAGAYSGPLELPTHDENPFDLQIMGDVSLPPPPAMIVDNDSLGFSILSGGSNWQFRSSVIESEGCYDDTVRYNGSQLAGDVVQWEFTGLASGRYRVSAAWTAYPNRATDSPFTLLNGAGSETVRINQQLSPGDYPDRVLDQGFYFADLVSNYEVAAGTLQVQLSADVAAGYVIADAIRVEQVTAPEIAVFQGSRGLTSGVSVVDFGSTSLSVPVNQVFTVKNVGAAPLTLYRPLSMPVGFSLVNCFADGAVLDADETATFEVRMEAAAPGPLTGTISFANSELAVAENPFQILVGGDVEDTLIVDDGDPGFSTVSGSFKYGSYSQFYGDDVHYTSAAGTGSNQAQWDFGGLVPGKTYRVSATWEGYSNNATNAPYTVNVPGSPPTSVSINERLAPRDFSDQGSLWEDLGFFTLGSGVTSLSVQLSDQASGPVHADAIRVQQTYLPEIEVTTPDGASLDNDGSAVDYGTVLLGVGEAKTFTVYNRGQLPLVLGSAISISNSANYTVSGFSQTTVPAGGSATFTVTRNDDSAVGSFDDTISFSTNDLDDFQFRFHVVGQLATNRILDNSDTTAGFVVESDPTGWQAHWNYYTPDGRAYFRKNTLYHAAGTGTAAVSWTFKDLEPGYYQVAVTWIEYPNRANDAEFTISSPAQAPHTVTVNQLLAPDDFYTREDPLNPARNVAWEVLDYDYQVLPGQSELTVRLTNDAANYVIADAVRIRAADLPAIGVSTGGTSVNDLSTLAYGTMLQNVPVTKTFTVTNHGSQQHLILGAVAIANPGNYVITPLGSSDLAPGASTTFSIQRLAGTTGSFNDAVTFTTSDPDHLTYTFNAYVIADAVRIVRVGPLEAAGGAGHNPRAQVLTASALRPIVAEAMMRWSATGLTAQQKALLATVQVTVGNLGGSLLGVTSTAARTIRLDDDAAGWGWFVDRSVKFDEEFPLRRANGVKLAVPFSPAAGKMDALTVVLHEMGHVLGLADVEGTVESLMSSTLGTGVRRLPLPASSQTQARNAVFASLGAGNSSSSTTSVRPTQPGSSSWCLLYGQQ